MIIKSIPAKKIKYRKTSMHWFVLKNPDQKIIRKKYFFLCSPSIFPLCKEKPLFKIGLSACNPLDWEQMVEINLKQKYGIRKKVLNKFKGCCANCHIYLIEQGFACQFHHKLPVRFGGKTTISNLIPLCPTCHDSVTFPHRGKSTS